MSREVRVWEEGWDRIIREVGRNFEECGVIEYEKGEYFEKELVISCVEVSRG